jgi:hypothetical protein
MPSDEEEHDGLCPSLLGAPLGEHGNRTLISFCVYNAEAGHNYGDIEKEGFIKRVFERNGKPVID